MSALASTGITTAVLERLVAVLGEMLRFERPADRILSEFFRARGELGSHDRAMVAETVYAVLRRLRFLELVAGSRAPRRLALAALTRLRGVSIRELGGAISRADAEWLAIVKAADPVDLPLAVECDLPDWLAERLLPLLGEASLRALAHALNQPAPLDLRVNVLKADRDAVLHRLAAEGLRVRPTPYSPWGIRVADKPALARHSLFLDGTIEVQDEGSQLLALATAPRRGEMVVDFCAGAGGKSLALGAMMRSTGRVYAFDVSIARLAKLKPRLARSGLSNVHPQRIESERDARVKRLAGKIDRVLVDAPCSGLGTLRRNPDLKWRQAPADVAELAAKQRNILAGAAVLLKPGGRLVYATCSLLPEENDAIVAAFLADHAHYRLVPTALELPEQVDECLRLRPDIHGTDAFFAAVMERRS